MDIDEGFAALVATAAALLSAYMNIASAQTSAHIAARHSIVAQDLHELSTSLYEVIALSVEAMNSKDGKRFQDKIDEATERATKIDVLRRRHRYSLPFIFEPLWYLKGLPIYVSHFRNNRDDVRLALLRSDATALREAIDRSLERYFFNGRAPGYFGRFRLMRLARRLETTFRDGRPNT